MSKQIIPLLLCAFVTVHSQSEPWNSPDKISGGWQRIPPSDRVLDDFQQIIVPDNSGKVFAFGNYTYQSPDTGKTWVQKKGRLMNRGIHSTRDFDFINENTGYYCTWNKAYKTIDGGDGWEKILEINAELSTIDFINPDTGIVMGNHGLILKTADGGKLWDTVRFDQTDEPYFEFHDLKIVNDTLAYAVGFKKTGRYVNFYSLPFFAKSTDGGKNWNLLYTFPDTVVDDDFDAGLQYLSDKTVCVFLGGGQMENGKILKTKDDGENWEIVTWIDWNSIRTMHWFSEKDGLIIPGYIADQDSCLITSDSGKTWRAKTFPGIYSRTLSTAFFPESDVGTAVCEGGYSSIIRQKGEEIENRIPLLPSFYDVDFIDDSTGFAIDTWYLYKTQNAGLSWDYMNIIPTQYGIRSILFADRNNGVLIPNIFGSDGFFYTADGGKTITQKVAPVNIDYNENYTGSVFSKSYYLFMKDSSTGSWEAKILKPPFDNYIGGEVFDYHKSWVVTSNNVIELMDEKVLDTLFTFPATIYTPRVIRYSDSLYMLITEKSIYAVRENGHSWSDITLSDTAAHFENGFITNDSTIYVYGKENYDGGNYYMYKLWKSSDTGHTWRTDLAISNANNPFFSHFVTDNYVYISGAYGSLYRKSLNTIENVSYPGKSIKNKHSKSLKISQNKFRNSITVISDDPIESIQVFELSGRLLKSSIERIDKNSIKITARFLSNNLYLVKTERITKPFIKY